MRKIPIIVLGLGGVGRELIRQIVAARTIHADRAGCAFTIVCAADSRRWVRSDSGISDDQLLRMVEQKEAGSQFGERYASVQDIVDNVIDRDSFGIIVDVTATDQTTSALTTAMLRGWGVVLANKKPLAGPMSTARVFYNSARVRYESTVGAGQPVIATLQYLMDTNDEILRIEGQLSGSLGFICGQLDKGESFSSALRRARESGFTEPDPREDLAGKDVMRKAIILGRTAGLEMSEDDVALESLYPQGFESLGVEQFMSAAEDLDDEFASRVAEAAAEGNVLRYVASIEDGRASVGLKPVPAGSTLANLKYVSFRTSRYDDEPLLIGGKGAGVGITAAGVVGDMVRLCAENATN